MIRWVVIWLGTIYGVTPMLSQCTLSVDLGEDISVCSEDDDVRLLAVVDGEVLNFQWSPEEKVANPMSLKPGVLFEPEEKTQFSLELTGYHPLDNLLTNPSFEDGDQGFTSDYNAESTNPGGYIIGDMGTDLFADAKPCSDRTSGFGQMLMANISDNVDVPIWCQEISVVPDQTYHFSGFAMGLHPSILPPELVLKINDEVVSRAALFTLTCSWYGLLADWNSGDQTTAKICIHVSPDDIGRAKDFALDDLGFYPVCTKKAQVNFSSTLFRVNSPSEFDLPCGGSITLGVNIDSPDDNLKYRWLTEGGNFRTEVTQAMVEVDLPGLYGVIASWTDGTKACFDSVRMYLTSELDQEIVLDQVRSGDCMSPGARLRTINNLPDSLHFSWTTENGVIGTEPNDTAINVIASGIYTLTLANQEKTCFVSEDITVQLSRSGNVDFDLGISDCNNPVQNLHFAESTSHVLEYSIDQGMNFSANPAFSDLSPGIYYLVVRDENECEQYDTIVLAEFDPVQVTLPSQINSLGEPLQLVPTLNVAAEFLASIAWSPAGILSCADCLDPVVSPGVNALVEILVTDLQGCRDSARIQVETSEVTLVSVPNAFTPNGDGINDELILYFHPSVGEVISWQIFNRQGALVFERKDFAPGGASWTGEIDGIRLDSGVFVSQVKFRSSGGREKRYSQSVTVIR